MYCHNNTHSDNSAQHQTAKIDPQTTKPDIVRHGQTELSP